MSLIIFAIIIIIIVALLSSLKGLQSLISNKEKEESDLPYVVMNDPSMKDFSEKSMPFDMKRFVTGGFDVLIRS
jgi:uncharacterized protein YbaA (DUF1428 family)